MEKNLKSFLSLSLSIYIYRKREREFWITVNQLHFNFKIIIIFFFKAIHSFGLLPFGKSFLQPEGQTILPIPLKAYHWNLACMAPKLWGPVDCECLALTKHFLTPGKSSSGPEPCPSSGGGVGNCGHKRNCPPRVCALLFQTILWSLRSPFQNISTLIQSLRGPHPWVHLS